MKEDRINAPALKQASSGDSGLQPAEDDTSVDASCSFSQKEKPTWEPFLGFQPEAPVRKSVELSSLITAKPRPTQPSLGDVRHSLVSDTVRPSIGEFSDSLAVDVSVSSPVSSIIGRPRPSFVGVNDEARPSPTVSSSEGRPRHSFVAVNEEARPSLSQKVLSNSCRPSPRVPTSNGGPRPNLVGANEEARPRPSPDFVSSMEEARPMISSHSHLGLSGVSLDRGSEIFSNVLLPVSDSELPSQMIMFDQSSDNFIKSNFEVDDKIVEIFELPIPLSKVSHVSQSAPFSLNTSTSVVSAAAYVPPASVSTGIRTSVVPAVAPVPPASVSTNRSTSVVSVEAPVPPASESTSRGLKSLKGVLASNPSLDVPLESSHRCLPSLAGAGRAVLDPLGALKRPIGVGTENIPLKGDKVSAKQFSNHVGVGSKDISLGHCSNIIQVEASPTWVFPQEEANINGSSNSKFVSLEDTSSSFISISGRETPQLGIGRSVAGNVSIVSPISSRRCNSLEQVHVKRLNRKRPFDVDNIGRESPSKVCRTPPRRGLDTNNISQQGKNSPPEWFKVYALNIQKSVDNLKNDIIELKGRTTESPQGLASSSNNRGRSPSDPILSSSPFYDLSIPPPDLWKGVVEGDFLLVVDDIGFAFSVHIPSERVEILDYVFDTSALLDLPRSELASSFLSRLFLPDEWTPLFKAKHKFQGYYEFLPIREGVSRQFLFPWDLSCVKDWVEFPDSSDSEQEDDDPSPMKTVSQNSNRQVFRPEISHNIPASDGVPLSQVRDTNTIEIDEEQKPEDQNPKVSRATQRSAKNLLNILQAASVAEGQNSKIIDSISEAITPLSQPEPGFGDWPRIMTYIDQHKPEWRSRADFISAPSGSSLSRYEDSHFTRGSFVEKPVEWFSLLARGEINSLGKRVDDGVRLSYNRFPQCGLWKARRFYSHGDKELLSLSIPDDAKRHIRSDRKNAFDSESLPISPPLMKSMASLVGFSREITATSNLLLTLIKEDPAVQFLAPHAQAALVSLERSIADSNMISACIHSNFMLARRDHLLGALKGDLFSGRPNLSVDLRTDPLDGPVISSERIKELDSIRKEIVDSEGRRPFPAPAGFHNFRGKFASRRGSRVPSRSKQVSADRRSSSGTVQQTQPKQPFRGKVWESSPSTSKGQRGRSARRGFRRAAK